MKNKEFENYWIKKLKLELKSFPADFIGTVKTNSVEMPGKVLIKGLQLFGKYEISDTNGNTFLQTDDYRKFKYILYANRNLPEKIDIPSDSNEIKTAVKNYEKYLDEIIKEMKKDYGKKIDDTKNFYSVAGKILSALNIIRY